MGVPIVKHASPSAKCVHHGDPCRHLTSDVTVASSYGIINSHKGICTQ